MSLKIQTVRRTKQEKGETIRATKTEVEEETEMDETKTTSRNPTRRASSLNTKENNSNSPISKEETERDNHHPHCPRVDQSQRQDNLREKKSVN